MDKNNSKLNIQYTCIKANIPVPYGSICCTHHQLNYLSPNRAKKQRQILWPVAEWGWSAEVIGRLMSRLGRQAWQRLCRPSLGPPPATHRQTHTHTYTDTHRHIHRHRDRHTTHTCTHTHTYHTHTTHIHKPHTDIHTCRHTVTHTAQTQTHSTVKHTHTGLQLKTTQFVYINSKQPLQEHCALVKLTWVTSPKQSFFIFWFVCFVTSSF